MALLDFRIPAEAAEDPEARAEQQGSIFNFAASSEALGQMQGGPDHEDTGEALYPNVSASDYSAILVVAVRAARGLRDADWAGKSDPYAKVKIDDRPDGGTDEDLLKFKTRIIEDCCDPVWNETHTLPCWGDAEGGGTASFTVEVWDDDTVGANTKLGSLTVDLAGRATSETTHGWFSFDEGQGEILLSYALVHVPGALLMRSQLTAAQIEVAELEADDAADEAEKAELQAALEAAKEGTEEEIAERLAAAEAAAAEAEEAMKAELEARIAELEADDAADEEAKAELAAQLEEQQERAAAQAEENARLAAEMEELKAEDDDDDDEDLEATVARLKEQKKMLKMKLVGAKQHVQRLSAELAQTKLKAAKKKGKKKGRKGFGIHIHL